MVRRPRCVHLSRDGYHALPALSNIIPQHHSYIDIAQLPSILASCKIVLFSVSVVPISRYTRSKHLPRDVIFNIDNLRELLFSNPLTRVTPTCNQFLATDFLSGGKRLPCDLLTKSTRFLDPICRRSCPSVAASIASIVVHYLPLSSIPFFIQKSPP